MYNIDVRSAMKRAGLFGYEVAAALGIAESSFSRKIARKELSNDDKEEIFSVINKLDHERREAG